MLRKIGNRRAVPVLGKVALDDNSPAVRGAAAEYLGKVGVKDKRTIGILAKILEDKNPTVRIRAIESLGFLQLREALPVLETALEDRDSGVRIRATEIIGHVLAKDFE
jgi:HEAT repeat protein